MIAKAKKKSDAELLLRIQYAKHLFEIMEGLFLVMETRVSSGRSDVCDI